MYRHYGLTGKTVKVKQKPSNNPAIFWEYGEQQMQVVLETPYFLSAIVLPHMNPQGFGLSHPYVVTLHKHDIKSGNIILNGGAII